MKGIEKFIDIGHTMEKFIQVLKVSNKNLQELNNNEVVKNLEEETTSFESMHFHARRYLRKALSELLQFFDANTTKMLIPAAVFCFNQDWDTIFDSIKDLPEFDETDAINVISWGHIYPEKDPNFLKQLRNGLAHSKFTYDFEKDDVAISLYQDTFKVLIRKGALFSLPIDLWLLSEDASSNTSFFNVTLISPDPRDDYVYTYTLRNNESWLLVKDDERSRVSMKDKEAMLQASLKFAEVGNMTREEHKQFFEKRVKALGLEIQSCKELDAKESVFKNNQFLQSFMTSMLTEMDKESLTKWWKNRGKLVSRVLSVRTDERNKNIRSYACLLQTLFMLSDCKLSQSQKLQNFYNTKIPCENLILMEEIQEFVEKSYLNLIFNYMVEHTGSCSSVQNKCIQEFFKNSSNMPVEEFVQHLRNVVVHPQRLIKQNGLYRLIDCNRRGEETLNLEVSVDELINFSKYYLKEIENQVKDFNNQDSLNGED